MRAAQKQNPVVLLSWAESAPSGNWSADGHLPRAREHRIRVKDADGQRERECGSGSPLAGDCEFASHSAREVTADRQTESNPLLRDVCQRSIELHERLENRLLQLD